MTLVGLFDRLGDDLRHVDLLMLDAVASATADMADETQAAEKSMSSFGDLSVH